MKRKKVNWIRIILFCTGIALTLAAWFIDKAPAFPWVLSFISPQYLDAKAAIDVLDSSETAQLPAQTRGGALLFEWWTPKIPSGMRSQISSIGRSTGIFNSITGVHRYELQLIEKDTGLVFKDFIWDSNAAKQHTQSLLDHSLLAWSILILVLGLVLSATAFVWEVMSE